jgi:hypothetical protein
MIRIESCFHARLSLLGGDPTVEVADSGVDGWGRDEASRRNPRGHSSQFTSNHQRATAVTVAGAIASIVDADVAGVDTSRTPDIRASSLSHDCCASLLEDVRQTAGSASSTPSSEDGGRPPVVSVRGLGHDDGVEVGVGGSGGESEHGHVIRVTSRTILGIVWVLDDRGW